MCSVRMSTRAPCILIAVSSAFLSSCTGQYLQLVYWLFFATAFPFRYCHSIMLCCMAKSYRAVKWITNSRWVIYCTDWCPFCVSCHLHMNCCVGLLAVIKCCVWYWSEKNVLSPPSRMFRGGLLSSLITVPLKLNWNSAVVRIRRVYYFRFKPAVKSLKGHSSV